MLIARNKYTYCINWLRPDEWGFGYESRRSMDRLTLGVFQIARWINQSWADKEMAGQIKER